MNSNNISSTVNYTKNEYEKFASCLGPSEKTQKELSS